MGDRVLFWRDRWCGEVTLEEMFPLIFRIAIDPEAMMASYGFGQGQVIVWSIQLWREVQDWEMG